MKRLLAFVVFLVVGIVLFFVVVQNVGWGEMQSAIGTFWGIKGALLLVLTFLMLFLGAVRWREILRSQGYQIPFSSLQKQYFGGFALSFFVPMVFFGSELFRSYALREFHGIPLARGIVSVAIERFLDVTIYLVFLVVGVTFLLISKSLFIPMLFCKDFHNRD